MHYYNKFPVQFKVSFLKLVFIVNTLAEILISENCSGLVTQVLFTLGVSHNAL